MNIREFLLDPAIALPIKRCPVELRHEGFPEFVEGILGTYREKLGQLDGFENDLCNVLQMVKHFSKGAMCAINAAFAGHPAVAYTHFTSAIQPITQLLLEKPLHFGPKGYTFFYRVRDDVIVELKRKELFHRPFEDRHLVSEERYSVPGLPCLYLGGSLLTCWKEKNRPQFEKLTAAAFWIPTNELKLLFVADRPARLILFVNHDGTVQEYELDHARDCGHAPDAIKSMFVRFLQTWPLAALCSMEVQFTNAKWNPEYIIPQLLLQWVANYPEFDGICYFSVRVEEVTDDFVPTCCVVLPAREICCKGVCDRLRRLLRMTEPKRWAELSANWTGDDPDAQKNYRPDFLMTSNGGGSAHYVDSGFVDAEWTLNRHAINLRRSNDAGMTVAGDVTR